MSFFSGGKSKEKDTQIKKSQFYVEFLGWMECRGLRGEKYTQPVIQELRRRHKKMDAPPKLTIQVSRKDLKITQEVEEKKKRSIKKIKFPTIPARDVTFVHQATRRGDGRLDDIVACIYLGYMPRTQRLVHVHVYRFDEPSTASLFVEQMNLIVEDNLSHIQEVEHDLASKGEIEDPTYIPSEEFREHPATDSAVGSNSSTYSDDDPPSFRNEEIEPDLQSLADVQPFDSVADELKHRLQLRDAPLLLPPKDYDTIRRAHGNLDEINKRRCLNLNIVGETAVSRDRNGSDESGVDITSPTSDADDVEGKGVIENHNSAPFKVAESRRSPIVFPKPAQSKDMRNSPQIPHKPTSVLPPKLSPSIPHTPSSPDPHLRNTGLDYSKQSSEMTAPAAAYVYPPKIMNSPMSPRMFPQSYKNPVSRQSSQNSNNSEGLRLSQRSDDGRAGTPTKHYSYGPNDDIYAMPVKTPKDVPLTELPPDYQDDDDLHLSEMNPPYGQSYLTRSLPADLLRDKMNIGYKPRPNSGELRSPGRVGSPVFPTGPQPQRAGSKYSPNVQRNGSSNR